MTKLSVLSSRATEAPRDDTIACMGSALLRDHVQAAWTDGGWSVLDPEAPYPVPPVGSNHAKKLLAVLRSRARPAFLHPGDTPWAYHPDLVNHAESLGIRVLSPSAKVLSVFANRLGFLEQASRWGAPTLLMQREPMYRFSEFQEILDAQASIVLRSVAPLHGGQEERVFFKTPDVQGNVERWTEHLSREAGEGMFFVERRLDGARKIAAPFARKRNGEILHLPWIDLSIQSSGRPWLVSGPAQAMGCEDQIRSWVEILAEKFKYVGYGEFHFMVDGRQAYLVSGVPHLTRWACVWERILGRSHVSVFEEVYELPTYKQWPTKRRLRDVEQHVVAAFVYAEHPGADLPLPGTYAFEGTPLKHARLPASQGSHQWSDDPWFGWVEGHGKRFKNALSMAAETLAQLRWTGELGLSIPFLIELLEHPWLQEGVYHAGFVDEEFIPYSQVQTGLASRKHAHRDRLYALTSGRVHALFVRAGTAVGAHQSLLWIESGHRMVDHALPKSMKVVEWQVKAGQVVERGQELARLETADGG